jgi:hypothetical protein
MDPDFSGYGGGGGGIVGFQLQAVVKMVWTNKRKILILTAVSMKITFF